MIKRYDLTKSDNYILSEKELVSISALSGTFDITTGFPVKTAMVTFATLPTTGRMYVSAYLDDGFSVAYEDLPIGSTSIEINYIVV